MLGYLVEKYTDMKGAYTPSRLVEEAHKLGIDLKMIGISDLCVKDYKVYFKGEILPPCDFVIHRIKQGVLKDKVAELCTHSYNRTDLLKKYISKKEQLEVLDGFVAYPKTSFSLEFLTVKEEVGVPFVAKGLFGSQGSEVELIHNCEEFDAFIKQYPECLFQEYISNSCGRDARLMVIKGEVVAAMERTNASDFRANFARGGLVKSIEIDEAMRVIARIVYDRTGVAVFGLDLLYGDTGYLFCEMNVTPGIEGMEKSTGVNVAGLVMKMIQDELMDGHMHTEDDVLNFIYESYIKAKPYMNHLVLDKYRRHPELTSPLLKALDHGNNVMITGSKGKGSVAHILSCLLQIGYSKVGLFNGPEISDFKERIQVNDVLVGSSDFVRLGDVFGPVVRGLGLERDQYVSPLGIELMMALKYFDECQTSINIIECGKGVQYDDTNVLQRSYGIINPVFEEHVREMGSLEEIAENKSYLIQKGMKAVYVADQDERVTEILEARGKNEEVPLKFYGKDFYAQNIQVNLQGMKFDVVTANHEYKDLELGLVGSHQARNAAIALALAEDMLGVLDDDKVKDALSKVRYAGRMEVLAVDPLVLLDNCINTASALLVEEVIKLLDYRKMKVVICIPEDKDYVGVTEIMRKYTQDIIFTSVNNPHYHFSVDQAVKCNVQYIEVCKEAINTAKQDCDVVMLLGTTAFISEVSKKDA